MSFGRIDKSFFNAVSILFQYTQEVDIIGFAKFGLANCIKSVLEERLAVIGRTRTDDNAVTQHIRCKVSINVLLYSLDRRDFYGLIALLHLVFKVELFIKLCINEQLDTLLFCTFHCLHNIGRIIIWEYSLKAVRVLKIRQMSSRVNVINGSKQFQRLAVLNARCCRMNESNMLLAVFACDCLHQLVIIGSAVSNSVHIKIALLYKPSELAVQ